MSKNTVHKLFTNPGKNSETKGQTERDKGKGKGSGGVKLTKQ